MGISIFLKDDFAGISVNSRFRGSISQFWFLLKKGFGN
jgi:hypothetical protein